VFFSRHFSHEAEKLADLRAVILEMGRGLNMLPGALEYWLCQTTASPATENRQRPVCASPADTGTVGVRYMRERRCVRRWVQHHEAQAGNVVLFRPLARQAQTEETGNAVLMAVADSR
jgi:hypothetical protein